MLRTCIFVASLILSTFAYGQCVNSATASCNVYQACFDKYCPCKDKNDDYFMSFGKKYCEAFLANTTLSEAGKAWRDTTLVCLQEKAVEVLPIDNPMSCDCAKMKSFAMSTHVDCYTQSKASLCDLPLTDVTSVTNTIIFNKAFINVLKDSPEAIQQVRGVFQKCSTTAKEENRRKRWAFLLKVLNGKLTAKGD